MPDIKLCVNIDHIATVRQARGGIYPDPLEGARVIEDQGAHGITIHLREDRRHIQDHDVFALRDIVKGKFNLEMGLAEDIIEIAKTVCPDQITLVPEKREELTTEGGLDVKKNYDKIKHAIDEFHAKNIIVSLFIEPDIETVELSKQAGADYIEIHTGSYCEEYMKPDNKTLIEHELDRIYKAADRAFAIDIGINAGHGLDCRNLPPVLKAKGLDELNIGFSIIARSILIGLPAAVREVLQIISQKG